MFSKLANFYARMLFGVPINDYTNGYRCSRRKALEALDLDSIEACGNTVLSEIAYQFHRKAFAIEEIPTVF